MPYADSDKNKECIKRYTQEHKEEIAVYKHERYLINREAISTQAKIWRGANKESIKIQQHNKYLANSEEYKEYQKKRTKDRKIQVLSHYSLNDHPICAMTDCGIIDIDVLTLDHIHDNGAEHRKKIGGGGQTIYRWLIESAYPDGFQVLCYNHNIKKQLKDKTTNKLKLQVLGHYSIYKYPQCTHLDCSVIDIDMLCIDHIDGGGNKHRKEIGGGGVKLYNWLIKNSFPEGFQTLCYNHNEKKRMEK